MADEIIRRINVIDMYHGNAVRTPDFAALKQSGVFGIIHKVSQGSGYRDPAYAARRKDALAAGLLWGAYHFLDGSDPVDQAKFFLERSGVTDPNTDPFLLACDYENNLRNTAALHQCQTFMREVDSAIPGVQCVLYSGNLIRETLRPHLGGHQDQDMTSAEIFFQQHRLWLAEYGPKAKVPWPWSEPIAKSGNEAAAIPSPGVWLWQFTEKGHVNPLQGATDGNFYDGTFEELQANWLA